MNCGGQSREILRASPLFPLNMCSSLMRGCCRRNVGDIDCSPNCFRQTEYGVKRHRHVGMILHCKCIFSERMLISGFDFLMTCWASIWRLCVKECKQSWQAITVSLCLFTTVIRGFWPSRWSHNCCSFSLCFTAGNCALISDWQSTTAGNFTVASPTKPIHTPLSG